ncbi:bifunctional adenosylcobinamide kinase/adenosylcobinamide-phosphate guanylyltransferase [Nitrincola sp. MINF-07-Sa-05]|uniref:bifunctional adenosylcobinamide kinase/adenosylcobinamide-phosphate guanylyltransferase n=1 Tax=Nitrincola salilacus TaxID=3400273 RepID=UPI00391812F5
MQLIIGGSHSGKRAFARQQSDALIWHSAYQGDSPEGWHTRVLPNHLLVLEGWECWLRDRLSAEDAPDLMTLRQALQHELQALQQAENEQGVEVCLILLEIGRGIVPIDAHDRQLRDLNGWFSQDAAGLCDQVHYLWHGLARAIKG